MFDNVDWQDWRTYTKIFMVWLGVSFLISIVIIATN